MKAALPVVLSVAGSDCSAGAGIQADLKAIAANGAYGLTAVTSVIAETPGNVGTVMPMSAELVDEQVRMLLDVYPVGAIKTGLLATAEIVAVVSEQVEQLRIPIVVDPVAVASTGDDLATDDFADALEKFIRERATLVTPNRAEAQQLLGEAITNGEDAAGRLASKLECAVLLKGGHFEGRDSIDWLAIDGRIEAIMAPRIEGLDVHGTGCAYSAAIAARLAAGDDLLRSVQNARAYLNYALVRHLSWTSPISDVEVKALANPTNPSHIH